jgi:hypothetical protein
VFWEKNENGRQAETAFVKLNGIPCTSEGRENINDKKKAHLDPSCELIAFNFFSIYFEKRQRIKEGMVC